MCNARMVVTAAAIGLAAYTGGASLGLLGGEAAAAGATAAGAAGAEGLTAAAAAGLPSAGAVTAAATPAAAGALTPLQTASLYTSMAGAGLSAYGQYQQASAAKEAAGYNAKVAELQRQDALDRGDLEQQALGRKIGQMRGQQTANMAANGLDLSSGSPEAILAQTDYYGLEDQRTVANNARREAAGYAQRGTLYSAQANSYSPELTGASSLLTSAGTVSDKWYRYNYGGKVADVTGRG